MKFFSQTFTYDDPWPIVSLAFFLRYPNPYAAHVISCDVVAREPTERGTLRTTRLLLKRGALPRWAPKGIVSRTESWIIEESEVDPFGRTVHCSTRNLDHVKVMQATEAISLCEGENGKTFHTSQVSIVSRFGWGLTKKIEDHGLSKFRQNLQRSREGLFLVLDLLRRRPLPLGAAPGWVETPAFFSPRSLASSATTAFAPSSISTHQEDTSAEASSRTGVPSTRWTRVRTWWRSG